MSFYRYITDRRHDTDALKNVMEGVVDDLIANRTNDIKPGILLGQIQSGKTRAFVGVIARGFDNHYDIAIVLTKNSVALVDQTIKRLKSEFELPVNRNRLFIWDVIGVQDDQLTGYVLTNKQIFVVKKEKNNMKRLLEIFQRPDMQNKRILVVDDEADQASVSFVSDPRQPDGIDFATIARQISTLRTQLGDRCSFLQVTATPYSLYLQPEDAELNQVEYAPVRPAFTHILHPHPAYIGGRYYFEDSLDPDSPASYIHVQVSDEELAFINKKPSARNNYDQRVLDNALQSAKIDKLRFSILNFLVGGAVRRLQEHNDDFWAMPYHCAMVIHTSTEKAIHKMQKSLVELIINNLSELAENELSDMLAPAYDNIVLSLAASNLMEPAFDDVLESIVNALENKHIGIVEVNSSNQVEGLLGDDGQLRLDNPFNIFVGGQSLDRGITIDHLIGFFYGRNPSKFQMDTVLQHSRMYGNRSVEDLAVTRFYTSARVYEAMRRMYWFDADLRSNIEADITTAVARFIAKQGSVIVPAGPNKLKASDLTSFKAFSRLRVSGFQTDSRTSLAPKIRGIEQLLTHAVPYDDYLKLDIQYVRQIIELIRSTFIYEGRWGNRGLEWDTAPHIKALEIALEKNNSQDVIIYLKEDRNASRFKGGGASFYDAPDDGHTDLPISRALAVGGPVMMLLKQNGFAANGWRDSEFYWPVFIMPANMPNYVYCKN
jgi:hypothetical protein